MRLIPAAFLAALVVCAPLRAQAQDATRLAGTLETEEESLISLTPEVRAELDPEARFSLGIGRLQREDFASLRNRRVLVATSRVALDEEGRHVLESMLRAPQVQVERVLLFDDDLPPPGTSSQLNAILATRPDVRVFQRNAENFRPTPTMFGEVDVIVIDLPLRGGRFFPETAFLGALLEEASLASISVLVLDRPIPLNAAQPEGPAGNPTLAGGPRNFLPALAFPALSTGELALLFNGRYGIQADLTVAEMTTWDRASGYEALRELYDLRGVEVPPQLTEWANYTERLAALQDAVVALAPTALNPQRQPSGVSIGAAGGEGSGFLQRLQTGLPHGASAEGQGGEVQIALSEDANPVLVAVAVWCAAAQTDASLVPPEPETGAFGTTLVLDGLRRGASPTDIARAWRLQPEYEANMAARPGVIRGTP